MKKAAFIILAGSIVSTARAQGTFNEQQFGIVATLFLVVAFMVFILAILKRVFDFRLKNKIVDKEVSTDISTSILRGKEEDEGKNVNIKWFALLATTGAGLLIVDYSQPLGIHSVAIMALSISVGFLGYYSYLRFFNKK